MKLSPAHGTPVAFDGQRSRLIDNGSVFCYRRNRIHPIDAVPARFECRLADSRLISKYGLFLPNRVTSELPVIHRESSASTHGTAVAPIIGEQRQRWNECFLPPAATAAWHTPLGLLQVGIAAFSAGRPTRRDMALRKANVDAHAVGWYAQFLTFSRP